MKELEDNVITASLKMFKDFNKNRDVKETYKLLFIINNKNLKIK